MAKRSTDVLHKPSRHCEKNASKVIEGLGSSEAGWLGGVVHTTSVFSDHYAGLNIDAYS
jgi:hypothetical protein